MSAKTASCILILGLLALSSFATAWSADAVAEGTATMVAQAAEDAAANSDASDDNAQQGEGKNCSWACLRWGKHCNVDPRGVYKCRRTCEKFGEQCE